jgi:hypothetical protein
MRQPWRVIGWLPLLLLTACVASQPEGPPVSGLLDRATREELKLGVDPKRSD